ncbi:MAG: zinc ribbon domain-containing protein [Burkholderiaceae bacterium]
MPIRDFVCEDCHQPFEKLVRSGDQPSCPACGSSHLKQQLSAFAVGGGQPAAAPMPAGCGMCGAAQAGACQFADTH